MLRHKYTKKRLRNKFNQKKRTRRQRGGVNNPKRKISAAKRREMERLSLSRVDRESNKMSPRDERDAQIKMAELLGEKCEAAKQVNDDGSIDCPNKRSKAIRKISKFHNDKKQNEGCLDYATNMMIQYNNTCYGDDTNANRKWDKNNKNYRNEQAALDGFYPGEASAAATSSGSGGENKEIPTSCKKPASKVMCSRYCKAKGVTDPKCNCCPGSDAAKKAISKENQQLTLMDGSVGPSARDLVTPQKSQKLPIVSVKQEDPVQPAIAMIEDRPQEIKVTETQKTDPTPAPVVEVPRTIIQSPEPTPVKKNKTCFQSQIDPSSGEIYYVEKNKDGTYTNKSQWEKPASKDMCKKGRKMNRCKTHSECTDPAKPYCNPTQEKCKKLPNDWQMNVDESGKAYFYGQYSDGSYSESQYDVPTKAFDKDSNKTQQPTDEQPAGDAKNNEDGCFVPIRDETYDRDYYVKKKPDGTFAEGSQWEEPPADQMCKNDDSLRQKTWDADKTIGSCREMDLHPGTEYWVDPETKRMSFEPIEGVKKNTVTEETDYYYNNEGKTTFDPHDGTCGDTKADDVKVKETNTKKDYIKMFFSSHFKKIKQIDDSLDSNKVIPWLAKR